MSTLQGPVLFAKFEKVDTYNWTDPANGMQKPIVSFKVLLAHGDGTVTRESITLPTPYTAPDLKPGDTYGFPVTVRFNKKRQQVTWNARADMMPFPAADLGELLGPGA